MIQTSAAATVDTALRRLILPLVLLAAVILRYDLLSFVYLLLVLVFPFLPSPRLKSHRAVSVVVLGVLLVFSVVAAVGQALFQITLISSLDYTLTACEGAEPKWRQSGFVQFDVPAVDVIRHLLPDVIVFIAALLTFGVNTWVTALHTSKDKSKGQEGERTDSSNDVEAQLEGVPSESYEMTAESGGAREFPIALGANVQCYWKIPKIVNYLFDIGIFFLLGLSGVAVPSVTSFVYYGLFLAFLVIWSVHLKLLPVRRVLRTLVMFYSASHLLLLYLYQFQFAQDNIPIQPTNTTDSLLARLFGLTPVIVTDCDRPTQLLLNEDAIYTEIASPVVILLLFFLLTLDFRFWLFTPCVLWTTHQTYCIPILDHLPSSRVFCITRTGGQLEQVAEPTHPAADTEEDVKSEEARLEGIPDTTDVQKKRKKKKVTWEFLWERVVHYSSLTLSLIMSVNFTISIASMMLWSVLYPSWPALVLLLWACFIWLIPKVNPKNSLYYTSPLLVLYALALVLMQYVFSLDLTDDELTTSSDALGHECEGDTFTGCRSVVLLVKTAFTLVFFASFHEFVTIVMRRLRQRGIWRRHRHGTDGDIPLRELSASPDLYTDPDAADTAIADTAIADTATADTATSADRKMVRSKLYVLLKEILSTYWVLAVVGAFLLVTLPGDPSLLKTVYLVFFFIFLITYQLFGRHWYYLSVPLWWGLVVYAVLELIVIYTFQFDAVSDAWRRAYDSNSLDVGFEELFTSIGLVEYETDTLSALLRNLLPPAVFIAVMAVQLRYFHPQRKGVPRTEADGTLSAIEFASFMPKLFQSAVQRARGKSEAGPAEVEAQDAEASGREEAGGLEAETVDEGEEAVGAEPILSESQKARGNLLRQKTLSSSSLHKSTSQTVYRVTKYLIVKLKQTMVELTRLLWRFLELHLHKIATLVLFAVAISQISAGYWVLLLLLLIVVPLPVLNPLTYPLLTLYIGSFTTLKMIYQVPLIEPADLNFSDSCPAVDMGDTQGEVFNYTYSSRDGDAAWVGFHKTNDFGRYVSGPIFSALLLSLWFTVRRYQASYYARHREEVQVQLWESGSLFLGVPREKAEKSIWEAVKYFINHFFEIYGVEVSWTMLVITVAVRVDIYGVFYVLALGLLLLIPRRLLAPVWFCYLLVHGALLMLQYSFLLGVPPGACFSPGGDSDYVWSGEIGALGQEESTAFRRWFFLSDYPQILDKRLLYSDFLVYILVCLQMYLFFNNPLKKGSHYNTRGSDFYVLKYPLDYIKVLVYEYSFWVSLFMIFLTAVTRVSLFGVLYLLLCFVFLYRGRVMLKDRRRVKWWSFLRWFTVVLLLIRVTLEIVNCVFVQDSDDAVCVLTLLFNAGCSNRDYYGIPEADCGRNSVGRWVDALNFAVITLQIIIFDTNYSEIVRIHRITKDERAGYFAVVFDEKVRLRQEEAREKREREQRELEERTAELTRAESHALQAGVKSSPNIAVRKSSPDTTVRRTSGGKRASADAETDVGIDSMSLSSEEPKSKLSGGDKQLQREESTTKPSKLTRFRKYVYNVFIETLDNFTEWLESTSALYRQVISELQTQSDSRRATVASESDPLVRDGSLKEEDAAASGVRVDEGHVSIEISPVTPEEGEATKQEVKEPDRDSYTLALLEGDVTQTGATAETTGLEQEGPIDERDDAIIDALHIAPTEEEERLAVEFEAEVEKQAKWYSKRVKRLISAIYFACLSHSEYVIFFMVILNVLLNGSLLSIVYAFLIFMWGLLSIPWPARSFWLTMIFYTMLVISVKYAFQFYEIPYHGDPNGGLYFPRLIGILYRERFFANAVWDLLLLISLLFHRNLLKQFGLWRATKSERLSSNILWQLWYDVKLFVIRLLNPEITLGNKDFYVIMVVFDALCFLTIVLGFASFGVGIEGQTVVDAADFVQSGAVPLPFVMMLLAQFLSMLVDRAIYMRKSLVAKFIFHICLLVAWHIGLFLILPSQPVTRRPFTSNAAAQFIYFFKCLYFIVSAKQIVAGYPTRVLGYFLGKKYTSLSGYAFTGYRFIPLLPELREVMDWMFTDTTLPLTNWLTVQEIYAQIYFVKVDKEGEKKSPRDLGTQQSKMIKLVKGSLFVAGLVLLIWGPLLFIAIVNTTSEPNPPVGVTIRLTLGGFQPLVEMRVQQEQLIRSLSSSEYRSVRNVFDGTVVDPVFSREFPREDFRQVLFPGESTALWTISPPARELLLRNLEFIRDNDDASITLDFAWSITREPTSGSVAAETISGVNSQELTNSSDHDTIQSFIDSLQGRNVNVSLPDLFPRFILSGTDGPSENFTDLSDFSVRAPSSVSCFAALSSSNRTGLEWWSLFQNIDATPHIISAPNVFADSLEMIIYSTEVAPSLFAGAAGLGVIGLYVSVVLVVSGFIRGYISDLPSSLLIDEIENPDPVLKLCSDIFLVRESKCFELEEILVGRLFAIFRSPETLIKLTEEPEEEEHEKVD